MLLIRHGHTPVIGERLVGRLPGVRLSARGRRQAERLACSLGASRLSALYSSPLERAQETAAPLASRLGLPLLLEDALLEVDFGDWTGLTFAELERRDDWRHFNHARGRAAVPAGEAASEVQRRIVAALATVAARHRGHTIAAVSHADVIRAAVMHYMGAALDDYQRVEVAPASVTALCLGDGTGHLLYVNAQVGDFTPDGIPVSLRPPRRVLDPGNPESCCWHRT